MGEILGDSFDVVEAIRILEREIEALRRDVKTLQGTDGHPQPAQKKLQRAPSERMDGG